MTDDMETDVLAYTGVPQAHRAKLHSTNPIERLNVEIERQTDVVGIFPNEAAIRRLVGAILLEENDEWSELAKVPSAQPMECRRRAWGADVT
jgi:transposase-like protein